MSSAEISKGFGVSGGMFQPAACSDAAGKGCQALTGGFAVLCLSLLEKDLMPGDHSLSQRIKVSEQIWAVKVEVREHTSLPGHPFSFRQLSSPSSSLFFLHCSSYRWFLPLCSLSCAMVPGGSPGEAFSLGGDKILA